MNYTNIYYYFHN